LLLARSRTSFQTLATTLDESIGNVFDKIARMLSIPWDGLGPGAALERFCATHTDEPLPEIYPPLPLASKSKLIFSFAGLHSSVERFVTARNGVLDHLTKLALARAFQTAAIGHLEEKLFLGLTWCQKNGIDVRHVVVSGGVASNQLLRQRSALLLLSNLFLFRIKNCQIGPMH
jgi:N6-L-threonylcarbamoyladenine synthase